MRHGVGRPRHVYDVTDAAQDLFPTNYDGLADGLLAAIRAIGGETLVDEVFEERRRLTTANASASGSRTGCRPTRRWSTALASWRSSRTSRATWPRRSIGADGVIRLVERNCAIHRVAAGHAAACQAELDLFREVLGADVERETHIAAGDRCCTYRIGG